MNNNQLSIIQDGSEWVPTNETRVRRVFSLLLQLKRVYDENEPEYALQESPDYIDLVYSNELLKGGSFCYRFDKRNNLVTTRFVDYVTVGHIVRLYSAFRGEAYLDNYGLYSGLVDQFSQLAITMGIPTLDGCSRPDIKSVVLSLLFAPSALPQGNALAFLTEGIE